MLGRSSAGLKGLIIILGVIDADYNGEIQIMAYTINHTLCVPQGSRIAQIVAIPNSQPQQHEGQSRLGGFGFTGPVVRFTQLLSHCPTMNVQITHGSTISLSAILDMGADVTIIELNNVAPRLAVVSPSRWH